MDILRRNLRDLDFALIAVLLLLAVFSCVALIAATHAKIGTDVPSHVFAKQVMFEIIGLVAMCSVAVFDYRTLRKFRWWLYGGAVFLLIAALGMPARFGAHSWIPLGPLSFQPSEFAKLTMIIAIAAFMANIDDEEFPDYRLTKALPILLLFLVPFALTEIEPALGQGLVMFAIALTMYTVYAKRSHFLLIVLVMVVFVGGITVAAIAFPDQSTSFISNVLVKHHMLKDYQAYRIITWLNPAISPENYGYNVRLAQIAIGSGQVFGEGFLSGIETRGNWIPNQWTDYIFTAIGEEFGFIGSSVLVLLFLILIVRLVRLAGTSQDTFGTYLVAGIIAMFAFQVFENIGADIYLSPSTGITLPFISYGGSSLIANYMAVGLALSVSLRRKKLRFS